MRPRSSSVAANPVLVGAVTVLVVAIASWLSYNSNSGLPFVPTYSVDAQLPDAASLVKGAEVRIGGSRVGLVKRIDPVAHRNGSVSARLRLELDKAVEPLPADSTVVVRPRSALGMKYLQLARGRSARGLPNGGSLALTQAKPVPVELDDVARAFDDPTRRAITKILHEGGNALAGRGGDLNLAVERLGPLLDELTPVMASLADPGTRLAGLVRDLGRAARIVAPAAETQAALFRGLDATFGALATVSRPQLQDALATAPPALDAATRGLPAVRPLLANARGLFADLRPGVRALADTAPDLSRALVVGTPTLRRSVALSRRLDPTFRALRDFAADPLVVLGIRDLVRLARTANPTAAHLAPVQTVCNYVTLFFRNVASLLSEGIGGGTAQRFIIVTTPQGPNNEGGPSSAPANGPGRDNFLHSNPYPNTASPGQPRECEAGNEPYVPGRQAIGNAPGSQGTAHDATTAGRSG
jgi:virulence factor Mce-like protein